MLSFERRMRIREWILWPVLIDRVWYSTCHNMFASWKSFLAKDQTDNCWVEN